MAQLQRGLRRRERKTSRGVAHLTFNTLITISDVQGNAISWSSAAQGFKGSRKMTPYAAQVAQKMLAGRHKSTVKTLKLWLRVLV